MNVLATTIVIKYLITLSNSISFTLTLSAVNYTDEVSLFINSVVRPLAPRFSKLHLAIIYL